MKIGELRHKRQLISVGLLGISVVLGVFIVFDVVGYFSNAAKAERLVAEVTDQAKTDPNDTQKYFDKSKELAEQLKKKNPFMPPPEKKNPVSKVTGIAAGEAFINGKWYKVGDKIGDAKVVAIEATCVKIEWDGKEHTFSPFDVKSEARPERKKEKAEVRRPTRRRGRPRRAETKAEVPSEEDPLAWMGVKLSPALRAKILEKWNEMSDEEKEKAKEEWNKLSDEEKEERVRQMEENVDKI